MEKWLDNYIQSKTAAEKDYQPDWEAHRYMIRGKMFAMHSGDKEGREILTVKLYPEQNEELREWHKGSIVPGYYMNKQHWSSIYLEDQLPEDLLKKVIDTSHELVFKSLTKKAQREILEGE